MRKILIVYDDIEILQLISDLLTERKLKVITTTKGLEVEELAIKKEPDLIILDINLPDIDGIEVLKNLKRQPITSFIHVIMLTGKNSADSQVKGLLSGADDYVTKPFDFNVLYARVLSAFRRSLLQTRFKHEQFNLLKYLIAHYTQRKYKVYTKLLTEYPDHPDGWSGFAPDLIIQKYDKIRCFNFETTQSLLEESLLDRLTSLASISARLNIADKSTVIVRTKENYTLVAKIVEENKFPVKIKLFKKYIRRE